MAWPRHALHRDPKLLPWMPPHIMPHVTYIQDPVSSCWRIDLSGTSNFPTVLNPKGRRSSKGSPWIDSPFSFTDEQRKLFAARAWNYYEMLVERRPLTPDPNEETREERTERLLDSEDQVEAMQERERYSERSFREVPVPSEEKEKKVPEYINEFWADFALVKGVSAAREMRAFVENGEPNGSMKSETEGSGSGEGGGGKGVSEEGGSDAETSSSDGKTVMFAATAKELGSSTNGIVSDASTVKVPGMIDDSQYTVEVIAAKEEAIAAINARDTLQFYLDYAVTALLLLGLMGLYMLVK